MKDFYELKDINEAADYLHQKIGANPKIAVVLGSGLGILAESLEDRKCVPFSDIPHCPRSTVLGHKGQFVFGKIDKKPILCLQGRLHYYEGYSIHQVTFPVRIMQRFGIEILILTNAAGAINPDFQPGDVMVIKDHISLLMPNPLHGPNDEALGTRFPDMSQVYDRALIDLARRASVITSIPIREGVYLALPGPSFETPAELCLLHTIGADAVGMSTVPEAIIARHGGLRVLAFSGISNKANLDGSTITTHDEVLQAGLVIGPRLMELLKTTLSMI